MRLSFLIGLLPLPALGAPQVLTDMPVTASLVQQVMGDLGEVGILLEQGGDAHDFQLRPSQARVLQNTDLLIWMGPEMTPWLRNGAEPLGEARQMQLLHQPGAYLRDPTGDDHEHEHEHEHEHSHEHGAIDPHAWLDPDNGLLWLDLIAKRLAEMDPENAPIYRANAESAAASLASQDAAIATQLDGARTAPFVAFHDAYGYFTDHYGLPAALTVSLGDASSPSAARLTEIRAEIAASGAECAFPEVNHPAQAIEIVVEGSGLRMGEALSPEGSEISAGPKLYNELLDNLAARISACADGEG